MKHVKLNLTGMKNMEKEVRQGLRSTSPGPMRDAIKQWAVRYRGESRSRFDRASKGDGTWKGLADSTIAGRRHGKGGKSKRGHKAFAKAEATGGGQVSILRDTGQLFTVLTPAFLRLPGQSERDVPFGVYVGFQGPGQKKRKAGQGGKATIREVAEFHHRGLGHNPTRKLLVDPTDGLKKKMAGDMDRAVKKVIKGSQVREV